MKFRCALFALGLLMSSSVFAGFEEGLNAYEQNDYQKALQEWRPLAEQGDAASQYKLGYMYAYGRGVARDAAKAVKWYIKAAEQGNAEAQFNLGSWFDLGLGGVKDAAKAVHWYTKAAEQGDTLTQLYLASMYADGRGVAKDASKAVQWYTKAAEQGEADAQLKLGVMYSDGRGVLQNDVTAVRFISQAAKKNSASALYRLAWMYEHERGVEHDLVLAHVYYNLASAAGSEDGPLARTRISEQLSPAQLREAQAVAEAWKVGTPLPTKSRTGLARAQPEKVAAAKPSKPMKECQPPAGKLLRYSDNCQNGDCVRTFENGCSKRFQAPYCFDPMQNRWTWKPEGC